MEVIMTKDERDEILCYIAQDYIEPIENQSNKTADELWHQLTGYRFNKLCVYLSEMVKEKN